MIALPILIIISILFIGFLQSIFMIAAGEYIKNTENFFRSNKKNYIKYIKRNLKKLAKSIHAKQDSKINSSVFVSKLIMLVLLLIPVSLIVSKSFLSGFKFNENVINDLRSFYIIYAVLIVFIARLINYISSNYEIDINKMILKAFVSLGIVILNYGFANYFVKNIESFGSAKLILKILLFFNTAMSIYIFDNFTKYKKKKTLYQNKLIDKLVLYFMLLGCFLMLNNNGSEIEYFRFIYYSISIYLIDFLAAYSTKTIGYIKTYQTIQVSYEYLFIYYLLVYLTIIMVTYGI